MELLHKVGNYKLFKEDSMLWGYLLSKLDKPFNII
jgi:hypothetical protein